MPEWAIYGTNAWKKQYFYLENDRIHKKHYYNSVEKSISYFLNMLN